MKTEERKRLPSGLVGWMIYYSRPWILLAGAAFSFLGIGVLDYLGPGVDWDIFWLGLVLVLSLLVSSSYLKAHFDQIDVAYKGKWIVEQNLETEGLVKLPRQIFLLSGLTALTIAAVCVVLLGSVHGLSGGTYVLLVIAFLIALFFGVPPVRLVYSGWGEISQTALLAVVIPALTFMLQTGELNRLLSMLTFPPALMVLALFLAQSFEHFGKDKYLERGSLLERINWQKGSCVHNILLLAAFLLVMLAALMGQLWALTWPMLLSLPFAVFQVFQMVRITRGARPDWRLLRLTSFATAAVTLYSIIIALFTG